MVVPPIGFIVVVVLVDDVFEVKGGITIGGITTTCPPFPVTPVFVPITVPVLIFVPLPVPVPEIIPEPVPLPELPDIVFPLITVVEVVVVVVIPGVTVVVDDGPML